MGERRREGRERWRGERVEEERERERDSFIFGVYRLLYFSIEKRNEFKEIQFI